MMESSLKHPKPVFTQGGLSVICVGLVLSIFAIRARAEDIPTIVEIIFGSRALAVAGWVLAAVVIVLSILVLRFILARNDKEIARLTAERNEWQDMVLKGKKHE